MGRAYQATAWYERRSRLSTRSKKDLFVCPTPVHGKPAAARIEEAAGSTGWRTEAAGLGREMGQNEIRG
jgi:hypothetical protein